jgi:hypothetical protein
MAEVDGVIGHMPLSAYIERFADAARHQLVCSPATDPGTCEAASDMCEVPIPQAHAFALMERR